MFKYRHDLADYYAWMEKMTSCEIGYPSDYNLMRRGSNPGRCIVPLSLQMPEYLVPIDSAIRMMPTKYSRLLRLRYTEKGTDKEIAIKSGIKYGTYLKQLEYAHCWLDAFLLGMTIKGRLQFI
jgi:hypothetical protein